jgi:hypothetical protein
LPQVIAVPATCHDKPMVLGVTTRFIGHEIGLLSTLGSASRTTRRWGGSWLYVTIFDVETLFLEGS